jgi:phosphoribosylformylglycinamidine cyclo-ligase
MLKKDTYEERGVSSGKEEVEKAIRQMDRGLFPGSFCKILPDVLTGDPEYCLIAHGDGPGTMLALAYLAWKIGAKIADLWVIPNQASLVMNIDDMFCAGARRRFVIVNLLGRNKHLIPGEVLSQVVSGSQWVLDFLTSLGIPCFNAGGETADIGDMVRALTMDHAVITRLRRSEVINPQRVKPGDAIVGFSSTGQARWETDPNSGIGSNGFTDARHDVLLPIYKRYYETYAPETRDSLIYRGKYYLEDPLPGDEKNFTIGSALLCKTRTYAPLMKKLFEKLPHSAIHALIHNSGGGQTKIGKFGKSGLVYVKNNLFPTPPIMRLIQKAGEHTPKKMCKTYNMGHRLEWVGPKQYVEKVMRISEDDCGIEARQIGHVESQNIPGRKVIIEYAGKRFAYPFKV